MYATNFENQHRWLFRGLIILLILFAVTILVSAIQLNNAIGIGTRYWDWGWNIFGLFFFVWVLFWIFRWPWHTHSGYWHGDEKDIARKRYARGEISRKEYMQIVDDLEKTKG